MRTIAIIGRPNVGKSTLFNRLIGRRRALVHDLPGVTRDRLESDGRLGELEFRVVDTAGLDPGPAATLEGRLQAQTLAGLEMADLGLFLIDARAGITSLDQDIAALLRRAHKPILLLANKAEGRAAHTGLAEAWMLGLGEPIAVSAEHGDGLPDLLEALRPHLGETEEPMAAAAEDEASEQPDRLRLAVVGRPNVGKSSLINRLLQSDRLLTGPEPGLTRDSVQIAWSFEGRSVELVDTAGLRRRSRVDATIERLAGSASVRAIREDARRGARSGRHGTARAPGPHHRQPGAQRRPGPRARRQQVGSRPRPGGRAQGARGAGPGPAGPGQGHYRASRSRPAPDGTSRSSFRPSSRRSIAGASACPRASSTAGSSRRPPGSRRPWPRTGGSRSAT